jgi:cysteine desulfurase/selenocysteine lyase
MAVDWAKVRAEFPSLQFWAFLNTATFGQLPRRATEAVNRHFAHRDIFACADFVDWYADVDRLRELIGRLIHALPADIAFIPTTSYALSLLVGRIDWQPGDRIVTLTDEFPNQTYYPALLASRGVEFVETPWERFYESVNDRTRLVAISAMSYVTGCRPPLVEIGKFLRDREVLFYLDGTQGCGALEFDMSEIRPDVFAVHGYKWLLAPNGAGFMYVAPEMRPRLAPYVVGWRSDRNWRDVDHLRHGAPEFGDTAEKYEGGMLAHSLLYAMEESIWMMLEIGPEEIERRVLSLAATARRALTELGGEIGEGPLFDSPILSARFDGCDASEVAGRLKARRVLVSARQGRLRVSTHFYNNENDIDRLAEELKRILRSRQARS